MELVACVNQLEQNVDPAGGSHIDRSRQHLQPERYPITTSHVVHTNNTLISIIGKVYPFLVIHSDTGCLNKNVVALLVSDSLPAISSLIRCGEAVDLKDAPTIIICYVNMRPPRNGLPVLLLFSLPR